MVTAILASWPHGAAFGKLPGQGFMDVILHLGAHRTATTTFQHYLRDNTTRLGEEDVGYWGPFRLRKMAINGLFGRAKGRNRHRQSKRAEGRIKLQTLQAEKQGMQTLLVSDENLLGTPISLIRAGRLYPAAGERAAQLSAAFGGRVRRVLLTIRSQDLWWSSLCALTVSRGHAVPTPDRLATIAQDRRSWRDVITDLACALPEAEITVLPFETHNGRPDRVLSAALQGEAPPDLHRRWLNRSPDLERLRKTLQEQGADPDQLPDGSGRWHPFTPEQAAELRENYADDLHWLVAGADGLANLTEDKRLKRRDKSLSPAIDAKGQADDKGKLAQHR